jgi:hypothetical protein
MRHSAVIAAVAFAAMTAVSSFASVVTDAPEKALYAGGYNYNMSTGQTSLSPGASVVYQANAIGSGSSWAKATSGNRTTGDYITPTAGGTLSDFSCAFFNSTSGGNTGTVTSGTVTVTFNLFDTTNGLITSTIGGFVGSFDFSSSPLAAGYYTTLNYTGLEGLTTPIVLPAGTDLLVTQQYTTVGTSTRQGTIYGGAATVGFSAFDATSGTFYQSGTGTAAGYYAFASPINNLYLTVGTIAVPEPTAMGLLPVAGLLLGRRRK